MLQWAFGNKGEQTEGRAHIFGKLVGVCPFCSNLRFMRAYYDKNKPQIYELLRKQYDKNSWKKRRFA